MWGTPPPTLSTRSKHPHHSQLDSKLLSLRLTLLGQTSHKNSVLGPAPLPGPQFATVACHQNTSAQDRLGLGLVDFCYCVFIGSDICFCDKKYSTATHEPYVQSVDDPPALDPAFLPRIGPDPHPQPQQRPRQQQQEQQRPPQLRIQPPAAPPPSHQTAFQAFPASPSTATTFSSPFSPTWSSPLALGVMESPLDTPCSSSANLSPMLMPVPFEPAGAVNLFPTACDDSAAGDNWFLDRNDIDIDASNNYTIDSGSGSSSTTNTGFIADGSNGLNVVASSRSWRTSTASPSTTSTMSPMLRPDQDHRFECRWGDCHKTFRRPSDLTKHERYHVKDHGCDAPGCTKAFATLKDLRRHKKTHARINGRSASVLEEDGSGGDGDGGGFLLVGGYRCHVPGCRKAGMGHVYNRRDNFVRHMRTKHAGLSFDADDFGSG